MTEKLRIGMFSWESLYSIKVGGVSPHVTYLSESLARKGHEVHVFTRKGDLADSDEINDVHYQRCTHDDSGELVEQMDNMCDAMVNKYHEIEKSFGKFDVLHLHDWHPVMAMYKIKKNNNNYIPWIMTFHSTEFGRNGNGYQTSDIFRNISHKEWLGGYESSRLITVSRQMRDELNKVYQIPEDKVRVIGNGVNGIRRKINIEDIKNKYDISLEDPLILFLGRMMYQKGPDILVNAISDILKANEEAKFVFAGDGDMRQQCQNQVTKMNIKDSCRFLGYVNDSDRIDLINACDIFCVPSRNEPFGITVLEAWTAEKPVLGTKAISIIDDFVNGIRAPINSDSIGHYMNVMLDNPNDCKRMGKNGKRKAEKKFNWDNIATQTEHVYDEVI
jgi:glycosyltransferase involved in cell wall biosynthesis